MHYISFSELQTEPPTESGTLLSTQEAAMQHFNRSIISGRTFLKLKLQVVNIVFRVSRY